MIKKRKDDHDAGAVGQDVRVTGRMSRISLDGEEQGKDSVLEGR